MVSADELNHDVLEQILGFFSEVSSAAGEQVLLGSSHSEDVQDYTIPFETFQGI